MARRPKKEVPSGEWMNTYADMVTLLLCFFVLLFSMSSVNAEKWKLVVGSFNPDATILVPVPSEEGDGTGEDMPPGEISPPEDMVFEEIAEAIQAGIEAEGLSGEVRVGSSSDGIVFLNFDSDVLFDGDSYILRDNVKPLLDIIATVLGESDDYVGEIRFLGHTDRANSAVPNNIYVDRMLSGERASVVCAYIEGKGVIEGKRLFSMGCGVHYPIAEFFSANRELNRRVEIMILQDDYAGATLESIYDKLGITTLGEEN